MRKDVGNVRKRVELQHEGGEVGGRDGRVECEEEIGVIEDEERLSGGRRSEWGDGAGDGRLDVYDLEALEHIVAGDALVCTRRAVRGGRSW